MTSGSPITDEMLVRYMCSASLSGEESLVEDWLSESDNNVEALSIMSEAVALQRNAWRQKTSSGKNRRALRVFYWAAAACVLILAGTIFSVLQHGGSPLQKDPAPVTAFFDSVNPSTDTIPDIQLPCYE